MKETIKLTVNGEPVEAAVGSGTLLVEVLRRELGLTGTKMGCSSGSCCACTVLLDGKSVKSCSVLALQANGKQVVTIEGLAREGQLHPIQQAFIEHGAIQCGFCTPGMILSAKALLDENPKPTEEEIRRGIWGNLCRCTGYVKIIDAIKAAASEITTGQKVPRVAPIEELHSKRYSVVGKSLPRVDARVKATGEAKFTVDLPLPRMLYGKVLGSPYAHARILSIDTSKAERLPGVKAVITGKDTGSISAGGGEPALAGDKVRYIGEPVAAVAATSIAICEEALNLIEVAYQELPAVFDPEEAMAPGTPRIHDDAEGNIADKRVYSFGDVEKGFRESDYIREDRFATQSVHSCYLEPLASIAEFDSSGKLTMRVSHQLLQLYRIFMAQALGLSLGNVRVIAPYVGGAHCSKLTLLPHDVCAAIMSRKTGRPVKMELSRSETFIINRGAIPTITELKTGFKKDGTLVACQCKLVANCGAYSRIGAFFSEIFGISLTLPYKLPNLKFEGYTVYTNNAVFHGQRGSGITPARFAQDSQLDMIANDLGMDPLEIRLKNAVQPGYVSASGLKVTTCGLNESIQKVAENTHWKERRGKPSGNRGVGIACYAHSSGSPGPLPYETSAAFVHVHEDGTVTLLTAAVDLGQGSATVLSQIAAEELGVALEDIRIGPQDTEIAPHTMGTTGSRITLTVGNAVRAAAADAKRQILEAAARKLGARVEDLEARNRRIYVKGNPDKGIAFADLVRGQLYSGKGGVILGKGYYNTDIDMVNVQTGKGNFSPAYSFGAVVTEVEVDPETGHVKLCKATAAHDCGFALNPAAVEGQIEGQVALGGGQAICEERVLERGQLLNPEFVDYKILRSIGMPEVDSTLIETEDPNGPFGAKECGEGPQGAVAPSVANAIYDAIGVRITDLPITPEKILKALKEKKQR